MQTVAKVRGRLEKRQIGLKYLLVGSLKPDLQVMSQWSL